MSRFNFGVMTSPNAPCYIIAEIGSNFCGDLDYALKSIDAAVDAGADAVKFQTFSAIEFIADPELRYQYTEIDGTFQDVVQFEMFKRLELPHDWHVTLRDYAVSEGVDFISSVADHNAVDLLMDLEVPALKIASEDLINTRLLRYIADAAGDTPLILSTGMATEWEMNNALEIFSGMSVVLLHCTSLYPAPPESCNLLRISALRDRFGIPVGFSDHTIGFEAAVGAVVLGACLVEKHFTLDQAAPGPDHQMSMPPDEFTEMVSAIRTAEVLRGAGGTNYDPAEEYGRIEFRRSIVAAHDLPEGHRIEDSDLAFKRPGHGLKPYEAEKVIGGITRSGIKQNQVITERDILAY